MKYLFSNIFKFWGYFHASPAVTFEMGFVCNSTDEPVIIEQLEFHFIFLPQIICQMQLEPFSEYQLETFQKQNSWHNLKQDFFPAYIFCLELLSVKSNEHCLFLDINFISFGKTIKGKSWRTFEFQKRWLRLFWFIWYLPQQPPKSPVSIRPLLWKELFISALLNTGFVKFHRNSEHDRQSIWSNGPFIT